MIKQKIYKCNVCGNVVFKVHDGDGELVCCNAPMELMRANSTDAAQEKHVPQILSNSCTNGMPNVQVGSVPHPMTTEHYIEWIATFDDHKAVFKWLNPGEEPKASICIDGGAVYEYCNLHGLWVKK